MFQNVLLVALASGCVGPLLRQVSSSQKRKINTGGWALSALVVFRMYVLHFSNSP